MGQDKLIDNKDSVNWEEWDYAFDIFNGRI
jgi:hypothetical protein